MAAVYLASRLLAILALAVAAQLRHRSFADVVTQWDGHFYEFVAEHSYPSRLTAGVASGTFAAGPSAFFPLFPLTTRPLTAVGLPWWLAALSLVTLFGALAAVLIAEVVARYATRRVALLTACCWSVYPLAGVLSAAYSEALLTMLAAGCLLALLERRWWVAGLCALLAGATRPTGAVLAVVALVAAALAIRRDREWRSLVAPLLAPLGVLGSWAFIGAKAGRWDAWFVTERGGWGAAFDGGLDTARSVFRELTGRAQTPFAAVGGFAIVGLTALVVIAVMQRPPAPVLVYLIVGFGLAVGTANVHNSAPRFLLAVFPLLVPLARLLAGRPTWLIVLFLSFAGTGSAVLGAWYFGYSTFAP